MSIKSQDVEKIAHLARIALNPSQIETYTESLNKILKLAEQMQSIDTSNVEPFSHPLDQGQRLRPDQVVTENSREHYLACAPKTEAGLYLVPQVIEE